MTGADGRRHVVHLCARLPVGGMENVVAALLRHVPAETWRSSAWCIEALDALGTELVAEGHDVSVLGRRRQRDVGLFFAIARRLRAGRVDVLHCHDELAWFYGVVGATLAVRPVTVVMTLHGRRPAIRWRHRLEQRVLAARTARIVAVSAFLRAQICEELHQPSDRVSTIVNGIDLPADPPSAVDVARARATLGLPAEARVVGAVGELSTVKHLDMLLEAVARANAAGGRLTLVLVGDGEHRARLAQKAAALGLGDVRFTGVRRDVPDILPALDVYACSSHYEGISLAILEAMARARAVVATAVGGNPELIEDGATGLLVPRADSAAMADALLRLTADAGLRARLGWRAREFVAARYGIDRMIRRYAETYGGAPVSARHFLAQSHR